ncbi:Glucose-1-phosphate adenylyltransferase [compost metagenome]
MDTVIENVYIMGSDRYQTLIEIEEEVAKGRPLIGIGDRCKIVNALVDKNSRIGNDVQIIGGDHLPDGDHALYTVKDGIVVVKKGAVIPDGTVI